MSTLRPNTAYSNHIEPATTLHGRWLLLARMGWVALVSLIVVLFATGIPVAFDQASMLRLATQAGLEQLGLSASFPAIYRVTLDVLAMLGFLGIAGFIFWRRSNDWMALLISLMLMLTALQYTSPPRSDPRLLLALLFALAEISQAASVYLFPSGRFVPRWSWIFLVPLLVWRPAIWFFVYLPSVSAQEQLAGNLVAVPQNPIDTGLLVGIFVIGIITQIYRYRYVSTPIQRQQMKWLLLSMSIAVVISGSYTILLNTLGMSQQSGHVVLLGRMALRTVRQLAILLIPLTLMYSILRYRLWDIDVIINRTLVYGTLTATLAVVYVSIIIVLQTMVQVLTGQQQSQLAIVASTLAIAALFNPLRRRIQAFIDRRFYRRKYDAAQVLAAFAATARDEVDLDRLSGELLAVVDETLQPEHVSLWLREPERKTNGKA